MIGSRAGQNSHEAALQNGALHKGHPMASDREDFFCSHCGDFEAANGAWLRDLEVAGTIDLRFHPFVVTENPKEPGEVFGTMNAAVCVADASPDGTEFWEVKTDFFSRTFYERSNKAGKSSLIGYLGSLATDSVQDCIRTEKFVPWLEPVGGRRQESWRRRTVSGREASSVSTSSLAASEISVTT